MGLTFQSYWDFRSKVSWTHPNFYKYAKVITILAKVLGNMHKLRHIEILPWCFSTFRDVHLPAPGWKAQCGGCAPPLGFPCDQRSGILFRAWAPRVAPGELVLKNPLRLICWFCIAHVEHGKVALLHSRANAGVNGQSVIKELQEVFAGIAPAIWDGFTKSAGRVCVTWWQTHRKPPVASLWAMKWSAGSGDTAWGTSQGRSQSAVSGQMWLMSILSHNWTKCTLWERTKQF